MKKITFYCLFFMIYLIHLDSDESKLNKLNKLYMLYDLSNNIQKQIEVINEVKKIDIDIYNLLMSKHFLKLRKYNEANEYLKKIKDTKDNSLVLLKLKISEANDDYLTDLVKNIKNLDIKVIYQIYLMVKGKNTTLSSKIKDIFIKDYPKSIYSYKILDDE